MEDHLPAPSALAVDEHLPAPSSLAMDEHLPAPSALAMDDHLPAPSTLASFESRWPQYAAAGIVYLLYVSFYLTNNIHTDMYENAAEWPNTEEMDGMMLSSSIAGLLSLPIFAFLFLKINRKVCACIISAIFIATCILIKTAKSNVLFHIVHSLLDIGRTGSNFMCIIYVTEISQNEIRGSLLVAGELLYSATHTAVFIVDEFFFTLSFSWFALVAPVAVLMCFVFWLPETPVYFLQRGNREEATRSLLWLRRGHTVESVARELEDLEEVLKATPSDAASSCTIFQELFNRSTMQYSGIVLALYFILDLSGETGALWFVSTLPLRESYEMHDLVYSCANVAGVIGNVIAFLVCDKKGRRILLFISALVCSICLIPMAICSHVMSSENLISVDKVFAMIFAVAYILSFRMGIGTLIIVVLADLFPPNILVIQITIMAIVRFAMNSAEQNFIYHESWKADVLHPGLLWAHSAMCTVGALFIFKYLPETVKKPAGFISMENRNDILLRNI